MDKKKIRRSHHIIFFPLRHYQTHIFPSFSRFFLSVFHPYSHINSICHLPMNNSEFLYFQIVVLIICFLAWGSGLFCHQYIQMFIFFSVCRTEVSMRQKDEIKRRTKWTKKKRTEGTTTTTNELPESKCNRNSMELCKKHRAVKPKPDSKINCFDLLFK